MFDEEFRRALKKLIDDHPLHSTAMLEQTNAVEDAPAQAAAKRCVRWGVNPDDGQPYCLEWAAA